MAMALVKLFQCRKALFLRMRLITFFFDETILPEGHFRRSEMSNLANLSLELVPMTRQDFLESRTAIFSKC